MRDFDILVDVAVGNDKAFTAPVASSLGGGSIHTRAWELKYGSILLTTTATVGNRQLRIQVEDGAANVLYEADTAAVVAASQTDVVHLTHATGDPVIPLSQVVVPSGGVIRVWDSAAIDVLDTVKVRLVVEEFVEKEI